MLLSRMRFLLSLETQKSRYFSFFMMFGWLCIWLVLWRIFFEEFFLGSFLQSHQNNAWKVGWESESLQGKSWISLGFQSSWRNLQSVTRCCVHVLRCRRTALTFVFHLHLLPLNFCVEKNGNHGIAQVGRDLLRISPVLWKKVFKLLISLLLDSCKKQLSRPLDVTSQIVWLSENDLLGLCFSAIPWGFPAIQRCWDLCCWERFKPRFSSSSFGWDSGPKCAWPLSFWTERSKKAA